jgi:hypothetical protein
VELEYLLISLYVLVDEWWQETHPPTPKKVGRPPSLSASEVLTLAVLAQWQRWRSERDFWRFADVHLRGYFPNLLSHGQLNRYIRALEPDLRAPQRPSRNEGSPQIHHVNGLDSRTGRVGSDGGQRLSVVSSSSRASLCGLRIG